MHAADRCRAHCEDESHLGKIRGKGLDQPSRSSSSIAQFQRVRDVRGGGGYRDDRTTMGLLLD